MTQLHMLESELSIVCEWTSIYIRSDYVCCVYMRECEGYKVWEKAVKFNLSIRRVYCLLLSFYAYQRANIKEGKKAHEKNRKFGFFLLSTPQHLFYADFILVSTLKKYSYT